MRLQLLYAISIFCLSLFTMPDLIGQGAAEPQQESSQAQPMTVNINTADAPALAEALDGVGLARARSIIEWRDSNGPFEDAYDLVQVRGISERIVALNEKRIRVSDSSKPSTD